MPNTNGAEDRIQVHAELEAEDTLAVRLKHLSVENPARSGPIQESLTRQAREIVERVDYLGGELALIEMDTLSKAAQIRSKKPEAGRFAEVILRGGDSITVEGRGQPLHLSREDFEELVSVLKELVR